MGRRRSCRAVHGRGRRRAVVLAPLVLGDVALLAGAPAVVERQEAVGVAVAAAVRERPAGARRGVVVVSLFGGPARSRLRRQLTYLYSTHRRHVLVVGSEW